MKRRIAALLAAAMLAAAAPTLAETMRIGDEAAVENCKEYITLREADNGQATELARIPLGGQVIYLNPARNGFASGIWGYAGLCEGGISGKPDRARHAVRHFGRRTPQRQSVPHQFHRNGHEPL